MADRLDRLWFEQAHFPFTCESTTRFADLDPLGHINNVAMAAILEDGRVRLSASINQHEKLDNRRALMGGLTIEYLREAHYPAPMRVSSGVLAVGHTSWTLGQIARQHDVPVAIARAVLVATDSEGATRIPDEFRRILEDNMIDLRLHGGV